MSMIRKDASVEGRFYVCPTFNELVLRGQRSARIRSTASRTTHSPRRRASAFEELLARASAMIAA